MEDDSISGSSLTQTAAGFHGGPNADSSSRSSRNDSRSSAGMMLSHSPLDRRPSDASLHSLHTLGLMDNISDDEDSEERNGSCSEDSSSSGSNSESEEQGLSQKERKASLGSFLGGILSHKRNSVESASTHGQSMSFSKKDDDGNESDSSYNSDSIFCSSSEAPTSSDNENVTQRRRTVGGSTQLVPSRHDAESPGMRRVESTDDLVRPYHNAYLQKMPYNTSKSAIDTAAIVSYDNKFLQNDFTKAIKKKRRKLCSTKSFTIMVLFFASLAASGFILKKGSNIPSTVSSIVEDNGSSDTTTTLKAITDNWSNLLPGFDSSKTTTVTSPMEALAHQKMNPCILNGQFEAEPNPTSHWYSVQSDMDITDNYGGTSSGSHSLLAYDRTNPRIGGVWQNIHSDCLVVGAWYEVEANVILRYSSSSSSSGTTPMKEEDDDEDTVFFDCDPTIPWYTNEKSCPSVSVRYDGVSMDVAHTIGPLNRDPSSSSSSSPSMPGWHKLYGVFQATEQMLKEDVIQVYVARAPVNIDIILDSISINPATSNSVGIPDQNCQSNLVVNGDAEIGDYRNWWIRGNGGESGTIEIVRNGGKGRFSFKHLGYRSERWRGMLQMLDSTCLLADTKWIITASFKYFTYNEEDGIEYPAVCDKSNPFVDNSCPVFELQFFSSLAASSGDGGGGQMVINTGPLYNEDLTEFREREWNEIYHVVLITPEMAAQTHVWLYVTSVDAGMNYELDDVRMVPADF